MNFNKKIFSLLRKGGITFSVAIASLGFASSKSFAAESQKKCELYSNSNVAKYTLIDADDSYKILDNKSGVIVEESKIATSKYHNYLNEGYKLYYFGLGNYCLEKNNQFYSIDLGTEQIKVNNKNNYKNFVDFSSDTSDNSLFTTYNDALEVRVKYSKYFSLNTNGSILSNINGECGYIAAGLLLGYYDTFYNSNILKGNWQSSVSSTTFNPDEFTSMPVPYSDIVSQLEQYNPNSDKSDYSTTGTSMKKICQQYFDEFNVDCFDSIEVKTIPTLSEMKKTLDGDNINKPFVLFGDITNVGFHSVLVYGYTSNQLIVHMGYKNQSEVYINAGFLTTNVWTGQILSLNWNSSKHVHSDNIEVNGHQYCIYCNGHLETINDEYTYVNSSYHKHYCSDCGYVVKETEPHTLVRNTGGGGTLLSRISPISYRCTKCGYVTP